MNIVKFMIRRVLRMREYTVCKNDGSYVTVYSYGPVPGGQIRAIPVNDGR